MTCSEWKKTNMREIAYINPDFINKNYAFSEIEYIDIASVGTGTLFGTETVSLKDASVRAKRLVKDGDTILSTVRPNRRSFYYIKKTKPNLVVSTGFAVLRAKPNVNCKYLYYLINDQRFSDYLSACAKGAAYPAVDNEIIERAEFTIPSDKKEQEKIACILSNYDSLIANNSLRIQILESMAKLIYIEWFVKFKFPGHESIGMVDSGTSLGEIPDGWKVKRVYDIVDIQKGFSYKSENLVDDGKIAFINLKCFERGGGFRYDGLKRFEGDFKEKHVVKCGDIVLAVTDMTQNREIVARAARIPKLNENTIIISMDVVKINPKNNLDKTWIYGLLNYSSFGITMKEFANGVNVLHLKSEPIGEYQFVMPDQKSIDAYSQIVSRVYNEIDNLQLKNQNLVATRNLLLHKLVSGEIDVSKLDIKISEEAT